MTDLRAYEVDFVTADGIRLRYDGTRWHVEAIRQLGEAQRQAALLLLERAEAMAERTPEEFLAPDALLGRAEYVARRLELRITHRRRKAPVVQGGHRARRGPDRGR